MGSAVRGGVWRGVGCKEQQYLQQIGTFKIKSGTSEAVREWRRGDRDGGWGMKMGAPLAPVLCCGSLSLDCGSLCLCLQLLVLVLVLASSSQAQADSSN